MNKAIGIILAVIVIVGGIYFFTRTPSQDLSDNTQTTDTTQTVSTQGRVVFSVTDAAANMSTISEINMQITSVDVHSIVDGWVTVSTTPRTFSLLKLNAEKRSDLLAEVSANTGTYDQVRLAVSSVAVIMKDGTTKIAKLPSGVLKINTTIVVKANDTASVNFDFLASKSLVVTGNGTYIFAPVVKTETRSSAGVTVNANNVVIIVNGRIDNTNSVGMDIDGNVKLDFEVDKTKKIEFNADGSIKIPGLESSS